MGYKLLERSLGVCGLCGTFDGDRTNDLHMYNDIDQSYDYLWPVSWRNSHEFADTWCNNDIAALSIYGDYNCSGNTDDLDPPSDDCLTQSEEYCTTIYNKYCDEECCH